MSLIPDSEFNTSFIKKLLNLLLDANSRVNFECTKMFKNEKRIYNSEEKWFRCG